MPAPVRVPVPMRRGQAPMVPAVEGRASGRTPPDPDALVPIVKEQHEKVGRNDPCWCGSGKKFKFCHGAA